MEAVLVNEKNVLSDMTSLLVRSGALLDDIQVHLDEILDTTDANPSELDKILEEGADVYHESILTNVMASQSTLASHDLLNAATLLTSDHIALLTKRQAKAVLRYTDHVFACSPFLPRSANYDEGISFTPVESSATSESSSSSSASTSSFDLSTSSFSSKTDNGLILAHAYVRYMGDLSGGQHIVKRLSKLFPIYQSNITNKSNKGGFEFYSFTSTNKTSMELKDMIRTRMDGAQFKEEEIVRIVDEASEAFRLNRGLLDSLVEEQSVDEHNHSVAGPTNKMIRPTSFLSHASPFLFYHPHSLTVVAALLALGSAITIHAILN